MNRAFQDIFDNTVEFLRTFGAFQLFFLRLLRHSPAMFFGRFRTIVKQVYNAGALSLVIVMVCGLISTHAMAQKFPGYYPDEFPEVGVIDGINLGAGTIRIDDSVYRVSPNAVIRSRSSEEDSMTRLRIGTNVGFRVRSGVIIEFWLLPRKYDR